jgi:hypothetical protein
MRETTEVLATLRNTLAILGSIAQRADLPNLVFLIGMAELEAAEAEAGARVEAAARR